MATRRRIALGGAMLSAIRTVTGFDWPVILMKAAGYLVCGLLGLAALIAPGWLIRGWYDGDEIANLQKAWADQQMVEAQNFAMQLKAQNEAMDAMLHAERAKDAKYEIAVSDLRSRERAALASLRNRPERASVPASAPACEAGATGASLLREDAEFLVREAARADELRAALERCQGGDLVQEGVRLDR